MAKEEKKVEVVSIDDAFGNEPIGDNTDQSGTDTQSEKDNTTGSEEKVVTAEAPEALEAPTKDDASEQVSDQVAAPAETKKTWKDFGVDDFEGKSNEEIAAIIRRDREDTEFRRKVYGSQADELGELRKFRTGIEAKAKAAAEEKKPDLLEQMPDMTDGEVLDFNSIYEKHPVKAVLKYARPVIEQLVQQQLQDSLQGGVKNTLTKLVDEQRDNIEFTNFLSRHKEDEMPIENYVPAMNELDRKYFGEQLRPPEELFSLAKLHFDKSPLYAPVYQLMVKHPTFSFEEAQQLAKQQMGAVETAAKKKEKIKQNIDKIDAVNSSTTASAKSKTTGEVVTIDNEFDI